MAQTVEATRSDSIYCLFIKFKIMIAYAEYIRYTSSIEFITYRSVWTMKFTLKSFVESNIHF